ncbi:MAG: DegT/DnrJ/EryC1/StrS aminotransferase family protein [Chloroflexi bacterium]|nr:DegT/DnrJ/EryC1/StrS aminotransferase family protein [Chloroflexota bacterium]
MIPFYRPYFDHSELLAAVLPGAGREAFESAVASALGARYAIAFSYARSALFAALKAMGFQEVEVVLPAFTCAVVAQAVVASGNQPAFADIDPSDFIMDIDSLKNAITPRTRAIVATHLYGYRADVDAIRAVAGDERIIVIEDRAQSLMPSASRSGELKGDIGLCSFGPNKQLSTVQGGVLVTNSADLFERIKTFREREMSRPSTRTRVKRSVRFLAGYLAFRSPMYEFLRGARRLAGKTRDDESEASSGRLLPDDYRVTYADFQARIGLAQLGKWCSIVAERRTLAELYHRALAHLPGITLPPIVRGATFAYYSVRVVGQDPTILCRRMLAQGVAVDRTYSYALPYVGAFRRYAQGEYPCALQASREVVNLPIYPGLSTTKAQQVVAGVSHSLRSDFRPISPRSSTGDLPVEEVEL